MTKHRCKNPVWIARIDQDHGNLLSISEPKVTPRLTPIGCLVDPVPNGKVGPLQAFPASNADYVWFRGGHPDCPEPARSLALRGAGHYRSQVGPSPDPTLAAAHV